MNPLTLLALAAGAYLVATKLNPSPAAASTATTMDVMSAGTTQAATPSQIAALQNAGVSIAPTDRVETVTQVSAIGQPYTQTFVNNTPIFTDPDDRWRSMNIYVPNLDESMMTTYARAGGNTDWREWMRQVVSSAYKGAGSAYDTNRLRMTFRDWDYFRGGNSPVPDSVRMSGANITDDEYKQALYNAGAAVMGNDIIFPAGVHGLGTFSNYEGYWD